MFAIDATFCDARIIATEEHDGIMNVQCINLHSSRSWKGTMSIEDVGKLVAYAASNKDGDTITVTYDECHLMLKNAGVDGIPCPFECCLIP